MSRCAGYLQLKAMKRTERNESHSLPIKDSQLTM